MSERECPRIRCTHGSGIQLTTYTHSFCATDAFPPATAQRMRCRADRDAVRYRSDLDRIAPRLSTPLRWSAGYDKKVCFVTRRCIRVAVTPADGAQLLGDSVWTLGIGESRLGSPNVTYWAVTRGAQTSKTRRFHKMGRGATDSPRMRAASSRATPLPSRVCRCVCSQRGAGPGVVLRLQRMTD
jgi:hypothetical protein